MCPEKASSRASESPYAAFRPVAAVTGPVGLPLTYSTWMRLGSGAAPEPNRSPWASTAATACRYHSSETWILMNPGPATSTDEINGESSVSAMRPAMSRGEDFNDRASDIATAVA